jgi:phosphatidate cytidylyltransferase
MHPFFIYIIIFLALGAIGFYFASRNVSLDERKKRWLKYFTYIPITGVVVAAIFLGIINWVSILMVLIGFIELSKVNYFDQHNEQPYRLASLLIYCLIGIGFILYSFTYNRAFQLYILIQVLVFDGFSQIVGQLAGKHRIAPNVSPGKTWEGLAGGTAITTLIAITAAGWITVDFPVSILFGLLTALSCFSGDMLASRYKRIAGIKDYSNLLPGHGGFLDRFDSFLTTSAVYYLLYLVIFKNWINLIS